MSLISINNLSFRYEGSYDYIFNNVSFQIDTDWKLGFVGRNGRGKTTFLQLLMNKYEYIGSISHSVKFEYFPYAVENKNKNTLDIIKNISPDCELWKIEKELNLLEVASDCLYRHFETLSGGEQSKVLLAALFINDNNYLLIDEPTNHLDIKARQIVSNYLSSKRNFILVSHDRYFLDNCVDHILSINKSDIDVRKGDFSSWLVNKQRQDNFELAENKKLTDEIERLQESSKRTSDWAAKGYRESKGRAATHDGLMGKKEFHRKKVAKLESQVKVFEKRNNKAIEQKTVLLKNIESSPLLKISPLKHHSDKLIDIKNLSLSYENRRILNNFNLTVNQGDRISLQGANGSGKTSILKLILDDNISYNGDINIASNLKISYVSQDTSKLYGSLFDFARKNSVDETLFMTILSKLDFSKTQYEKDIANYSSGQKKKILIAKSLSEYTHLYIWDEPLNFIDILSRIQIEQLIKQYKPTMLFVEHDKVFVDEISTGTVIIK